MSLIATFIVVLLPTAIRSDLKTFYLSDLCPRFPGEIAHSPHLLLGAVTESFNSTVMIQAAPKYIGYDVDTNSTLEVSAPPGHHIVASVRRLQLRNNCVDNLTIYADDKKHTFCGLQYDEYETHSLTAQGSMVIRFNTDSIEKGFTYNSIGFELTVTAYKDAPCNSTTDFSCENNRCIAGQLNCSRHNHCGDNSNQQCATVTDTPRNCSYGQLVCANGNCVYTINLCNGYDDCGDLSDELHCHNCPGFEFSCRNGKCISNLEVCDKRNDCGDWSDEEHCRYKCSSWEFSCRNGHCVDGLSVCDGENDCGDWSDEQNCTSTAKHWSSDTYLPLLIGLSVGAVLFIVIIHISISKWRNRAAYRQPLPVYRTHPPH